MSATDGARAEVEKEHIEFVSAPAKSLYLRVVAAGGTMEIDDPALDSARAELSELGLLVFSDGKPSTAVATDPSRLAGKLSSAWQKQALALLSQAVSIPTAMHELSHAYQSLGQQFHPGGPVEHIHGLVEIQQRLEILLDNAEHEVLTAQPGGRGREGTVQRVEERDLSLVRRGLARRIVYHPSARYSAPHRQYVERMTECGAEVRTLAEPFIRLFIIDRRIAVIPIQGDTEKAAFVSDQAIVGYLLESFERLWERSSPFLGATEVPPEVISRMRTNILRMMIQGVGHRVIARNLGISERTLARHIADFREEYESETLFQLGWRMALNSAGQLYAGEGPAEEDEAAPGPTPSAGTDTHPVRHQVTG